MKNFSPKRYLTFVASLFALLVGALLLFNLVVDPYDIYRLINLEDYGVIKNGKYDKARLAKAHAIASAAPTVIALGTSRTEWGVRMNHPVFADRGGPSYNLGIPGGSVYELQRYLEFAQAQAPLDTVVFGLDFFSFNERRITNGAFSEQRLAGRLAIYREKIATVVSIDTFVDSVETIVDRSVWQNYTFDERGQASDASILGKINRTSFFDTLWSNAWSFIRRTHPNSFDRFGISANEPPGGSLAAYRAILRSCLANEVRLYLYISPTHALKNLEIDSVGLWHVYEQWKRDLLRIYVEETARAGKPLAPVWDFADVGTVNQEPVPTRENKDYRMEFFWNGGHYNKELGDRMLSKLANCQTPAEGCNDDFGTPLTPDTLETSLARIRSRLKVYALEHPELVKELNRFMRFAEQKAARR